MVTVLVSVVSYIVGRNCWYSRSPRRERAGVSGLSSDSVLHGSLAYRPQHSYIGDEMLTWPEILGFDCPIHGIVNLLNLIMRGVFGEYPDLILLAIVT